MKKIPILAVLFSAASAALVTWLLVHPRSPLAGASTNTSPALAGTPQSLSWAEIETPDYNQYASNLRRIGCPEATVEDIVIADVNAMALEKAKPRLEELRLSLARYSRSAGPISSTTQLVDAVRLQLKPLNTERLDIIAQSIGHPVDEFKTAAEPWAFSLKEIAADEFPFLSPEKSAMVSAIRARFADRLNAPGLRAQSVNDEQRKLLDENRVSAEREISKLLTPVEFEDYLVHHSPESTALYRQFANVAISDPEFRQLLKVRRDYSAKYGFYAVNNDDFVQRFKDRQFLNDQIKSILGDERYQDYQMYNDPDYFNAARFAKENSLPADQADHLYKFQQGVEQQILSLRISEKDPEALNQKVSSVTASALEQLSQFFDEQTRTQYIQSRAGTWLGRFRPGPDAPTGARGVIDTVILHE